MSRLEAIEEIQLESVRIRNCVRRACEQLGFTDYRNVIVTCKIVNFGDVVWHIEFLLTSQQLKALPMPKEKLIIAILNAEELRPFEEEVLEVDFVVLED